MLGRGVLPLLLAVAAGCGAEEEPLPETPPRQLSASPFHYPQELWDAGVSGETLLRIHISAQGVVDTVQVERSSGHEEFDEAALRGARELRFEPATRGGEPVPAWWLLPVQFHPDSVPAAP